MPYKSLKKVLRTINDKKDLDKDNIIEKIQEELKEYDQDLYEKWKKGKFDVNHEFSLNISGIEGNVQRSVSNGIFNSTQFLTYQEKRYQVET